MKYRNKSIKSALALATAAFISMPVVAESVAKRISARHRTGARCVAGYRGFAGPASVSASGSRVQFNLWRPKADMVDDEELLDVSVDFINAETGVVLRSGELQDLAPGKGAVVSMRVGDSTRELGLRLVGARMKVRELAARDGARTTAGPRKRCVYRELPDGTVSGPRVHGTLVVRNPDGWHVSRDVVSGDKVAIPIPKN